MAISAPGIGSQLDVNAIVAQLMAVEARPLQVLAQKEAGAQAKLSAYGSVKSALSALQTAMAGLADPARFSAYKSSLSETGVVSATLGTGAAAGKYSIEVQTLAQAQKLKSEPYGATTTVVGSGTLTIDFGTYDGGSFTLNPDKASKTIEIAAGEDSLTAVRDAINEADAGVQASIVNDGTGYRLVIGSQDTGAANALRISVNDDDSNDTDASGLSALSFDDAGGTSHLVETVEALDAVVDIDGITITSDSNTLDDAIEGVTLNLLKESDGESLTLTVARDTVGVKSGVEAFVKAYNDLTTTLSSLSAYNADTKQAAILQGDATVRTLQTRMRSMLGTALAGAGGGLSRLSDIGVSVQLDGTLKLDSTKLTKVLNDPTKDVATLFASVAKPTDSLVSFVSAATGATAGNHALNITQQATQGKAVGNQAAVLTITEDVNDGLVVDIDGASATVTVAAGTYTADSLAAAVQAAINGADELSDNDIRVSVSQVGGVLTVTSDRYGSASVVEISGGSAVADLFGTATSTDGLDVAGTIGGAAATGSGQRLTGMGITVEITGGSTGARGSIGFAQGFASKLADMAAGALASDGLLDGRTDGLDRTIKDIVKQRERLGLRLAEVEKRYRAQFTALDVMMSSMLKTSEYLKQQLANLPKIGGE